MPKRRKRAHRPEGLALAYCRVSATESQSDSTLSLEHQSRATTTMAELAGYAPVEVVSERHTASKTQPALEACLARLASGEASALYVSKIDRLSRKGARDVLRIVDLAEEQGWRLVALDVGMDTGTPTGRMMLTMLAAIAEMESGRRSERMREYHEAREARGEASGRDYGPRPLASPETLARVRTLRDADRLSYRRIADTLNADWAEGRRWHPSSARRAYLAAERLTVRTNAGREPAGTVD